MAVLNVGETWHLRHLESYLTVLLSKGELDTVEEARESAALQHVKDHARGAIEQQGLLDDDERQVIQELIKELGAVGYCLSCRTGQADELIVLVERLRSFFLPQVRTMAYKRVLKAKTNKGKPPLGDVAGKIYEKLMSLPEHKGMTSPMLSDWLCQEHRIILDDSTIRKNHLKQLKPYGLKGKKKIGYYIEK